ncbi:uncharacterized protein OCT59_008509 [Rhizophagus irregularis]|uniref:uncharacterized protein n=1 Tax=Rhizophagus irregularis TaxID=588596 RepID=UPI0033237FB6|nr:hypothetical protein OCT59_008509 [Rhizophagus irregularis]
MSSKKNPSNILTYIENNLICWTSGNEKIDNFVRKMQLKINNDNEIVFEWILYNQFNEIKEIGKNGPITVYSAKWKDGPLYKKIDTWDNKSYVRDSNKKVALKCLHNSQKFIDSIINEAKKYSINHEALQTLYGISQNPDTGDYILVQNNYIWDSKNEKIDDFIQEKQFKINNYNDEVLEWIPYNQFNEIKLIGTNGPITVYSAIWKDGPLHKKDKRNYYTRDSNKEVALKCLHKSQESVDSLINKAKKYPTKHEAFEAFQVLYGISQNPDTGDYILVLTWTSGNEKIDDFIKERQLEINDHDIMLKWIPYNQFNNIKETCKNSLITLYSAIWTDGPLYKKNEWNYYTRDSNKEVALKCLHKSQESIVTLIDEAKKYSTNNEAFQVLYGISQNPNTGNYILVQNNSIKLANWISGNEIFDDFIQEMQLKINNRDDLVFEWIPYDQFNEIKETVTNGLITIYLAIWKDGPLKKNWSDEDNWSDENYLRDSNREVSLKCLHNSQESINSIINEIKKYPTNHEAFQILYGISQNPVTGDYILVQNNYIWNSENEKINDFIRERQLIFDFNGVMLEWVPYNQFNEIKETGKNDLITTVYSAIWKDGPLQYFRYKRDSNKVVALKYLYNSQESIDWIINEAKKYPTNHKALHLTSYEILQIVLYGISQNPVTGDYIFVLNWTSGNEKIDDFIQKERLKINSRHDGCDGDVVFEWIPYNQFFEIKETNTNSFITVYSAIWKNGPLCFNYDMYARSSDKEVALKCLHNSQNSIDYLINEAKKYPTNHKVFQVLYGISQNPDTGNYILVQDNSINMLNWFSGNEKVDEFIQEKQLKINNDYDIVPEWIPYNQFFEIKETKTNGLITVYSAIWKNGPLCCNYNARRSDKEVSLRYLHNSQESIDYLINEAKKYPTNNKEFQVLYGISQNPDTGNYILVQDNSTNMLNWISGNDKIDDFIQERQLKINNYYNVVPEWIPYDQFNEIQVIGTNGFITVYSAIWKDGPLYKEINTWDIWSDGWNKNYARDSDKKVALICLHNSQDSIEFLLNKAKKYSIKHEALFVLYGISQNSDTNDYILIQNDPIVNIANWFNGNEKIDDFIQEIQSKIDNNGNNLILEWIPYNQFNEIKEIGKNGSITVYSAIWRDGPLHSNRYGNYTRNSNKKIALQNLLNSQNSVDFFINKAKKYLNNLIKCKTYQVLYGISQNPKTNDYILVLTWTSGNEKIDDFIQEMQLKINISDDSIEGMFEWIPYNQFNEIKETGTNGLITVYSAIWKDSPLYYGDDEYEGDSDKEVALKYLHKSQESIDYLINEVKIYPTILKAFQALYGISQNPVTGDYILVQNYSINLANWISGNEKIDDFIQKEQLKINCSFNNNGIKIVVLEWIPYNQFNEIKEIGTNGLITIYSAIWKDGPLYCNYDCDYDDYDYGRYIRDSGKEVALKYLHKSQESIDSLINEAKKYPTKYKAFQILYGISQSPDTGDYILVQMNYTWDSGNEKIDDLIQESQLRINDYHDDLVLEWIPYNQFNGIKETGTNGLITVYSAIWKDGPLCKKIDIRTKYYERDSNKKVVLKCLHNSQKSIDSLINKVKKYPENHKALQVLYGISQNPNTGDYILVQRNCVWDSGNEKIDNFIQESRLKINNNSNIVLEWIPYNQFNEIKESDTNSFITIYSAIWRDGPLYIKWNNYTRDSNKKVALKYLHNSQNFVDVLINKAEEYVTKLFDIAIYDIYGISQDPKTNNYILVLAWISGNEKIDDFIWEMQSENSKNINNRVFEWIPYNQFNEIKETGTNGLMAVYSAIWRDGPLYVKKEYYSRDSNKKVVLKCLNKSQQSIDSIINKVRKYLTNMHDRENWDIYGISQDSNTNDYILVLKLVSGNEKIDGFIKEMQLNSKNDLLFKWIPYGQFSKIKEISKNNSITIYSAVWTDGGLLQFENYYSEDMEDLDEEVALKLFHSSQDPIDSLINEVKKYSASKFNEEFLEIYGISRNPDTNDYILAQKNFTWVSGNKKIDDFIQEMQLKINNYEDVIFEWIPYYQFDHIKETSKNSLVTVHSAVWRDGPLHYHHGGYTRDSNKEVALKYLHNSENSIDFLINKAKKYSTKYGASFVLYGISQNPNTDPNKIIALKCLHNSQNINNKILNEIKNFPINKRSNILSIYGISQNPNTKEYIIVFKYAKKGNFNNWINKNYEYFNWQDKLSVLDNIICGLKEIHQKKHIHHDFHTGNVLFLSEKIYNFSNYISISDMGLFGEVGNKDETKIYGVMPYVAPEVLRGELYTQAADIYSLDPNNRPNIIEVDDLITSFYKSSGVDFFIVENEEIEVQFNEAEKYRKSNLSSIKNYQAAIHPQAIYVSRLLNPFIEDLPKYNDNSKC